MNLDLLVPDIGDFENVEIIEVLVKKGDKINKNDPVVTLESDKSSVEVPSNYEGTVENINVKICFVFGREISGLSNEELQMCDYHIKIPTDEDFSSLNLSHAVQIISYVLKMEIDNIDLILEIKDEIPTFEDNEYLIDHFDKVMKQIDFYDQENPKQVKTRVRRLIKRLQPDKLETGILRGFLSKIEQMLNKKN